MCHIWQTLSVIFINKMNSGCIGQYFFSVQREVLGIFNPICVLHFEAALTNFAVESSLNDVSI